MFFQACGVDVRRFWPKTLGRIEAGGLDGSALAPLSDVRGKLLVMRGLHGSPRGHGRDVPVNGHSLGTNSRLTAAGVAGGLADGISVDQVIATHANYSTLTPLPSMQVGASTWESFCDGKPCSYSRSISWKSPTQPMYKDVDPLTIL